MTNTPPIHVRKRALTILRAWRQSQGESAWLTIANVANGVRSFEIEGEITTNGQVRTALARLAQTTDVERRETSRRLVEYRATETP